MMPKLMNERLDELGIDFSVLYPTAGLGLPLVPDAEARRAACRAFNTFSADYFGPFSDRMTPSAVIPMHTPEEAIEELEYAVRQLGLKVVMLGSLIARPIEAVAEKTPEAAEVATWRDVLVSTACMTMTRCGPNAWNSKSLPAFTPARAVLACASRRRTSATTTSATLRLPTRRCARPCFWAA